MTPTPGSSGGDEGWPPSGLHLIFLWSVVAIIVITPAVIVARTWPASLVLAATALALVTEALAPVGSPGMEWMPRRMARFRALRLLAWFCVSLIGLVAFAALTFGGPVWL